MQYRLVPILSSLAFGCLCGAGAAHDAKGPISEKTYQEAARHCHSDRIFRLQRGKETTVFVNGLIPADEHEPPEIRIVECIRRYLGIPRKYVIVLAN
jgi:hypothetical protein